MVVRISGLVIRYLDKFYDFRTSITECLRQGLLPKRSSSFPLLREQTSRSFSVYLDSHSQSVFALNIKFLGDSFSNMKDEVLLMAISVGLTVIVFVLIAFIKKFIRSRPPGRRLVTSDIQVEADNITDISL